MNDISSAAAKREKAPALAFVALLVGNAALAFGPFLVRQAGTGPVAAGFWRLALALPFLWLLARLMRQPVRWHGPGVFGAIALAALFFAADLAAWHEGIWRTKLGNATLFGNISSFAFAAWGLWLARRWPTPMQALALALAAAGCALLMAGSLDLSPAHFQGDLFALAAGILYTGYLILVERTRGALQPLPLLLVATAVGAAVLLPLSAALGEQIWPDDFTAVLALALCSQVVGQGLLVYALGLVPPLVVGVALLTQPAISALLGWLYYREMFSPLDWIGAIAIVAALVMVRLQGAGKRPS